MSSLKDSGRAASLPVAAVLAADAALHLYWTTGATWPAGDDRTLSTAVLGFVAPFTPPVLIPLALMLSGAAFVAWKAARSPRTVYRLGALVVALGLAAQVPVRIGWAFSGTGLFRTLNIALYLPLCAVLAVCALIVARPKWPGRAAVAAVAALSSVLALLAYTPMAAASAEARDSYVDTSVARFHYTRAGSGPALVLVSAGMSSTFSWSPQAAALSATRTVYVVDLPGQGYTELRDPGFAYDLPAMDAALSAFLDALGLSRVDLGGHSWSGGWSLYFAQRHPERVGRLVLLAPSGLDEPDSFSWEILKKPVLGELIVKFAYTEDAMGDAVAAMFARTEPGPQIAAAWWDPLRLPENRRSIWLLERNLDWRLTQEAMPATNTPVLVLWGGEDTVLPVAQAARFGELLPSATVTVVPGCGHAITLDCPAETNAAMAAFLA
ncbi:hypothetical protein Afil01_21960 [Actinorhabdospora filicis]|uniref:AB hydrolase-1 domain-containing protein n=1 Tax=Actinorhabdospora filicis TaxID=1785913 RepID=A0A9W6W8A4_9ACTN|nr:alpha/beta fold hydrolase [Actinorhabdospora filicis]GLZ77389.1 hypothetical protein Afil01_21960 [Actinorhabdospora filicis]